MTYEAVEYIARITCCRCGETAEASSEVARGLKTVGVALVEKDGWSRLSGARLACPACADRPDGDGWVAVDQDVKYTAAEVMGMEFASDKSGGLWTRGKETPSVGGGKGSDG